jgi:sialic acid synthase SpsE/sugar phosphate isomerase/epimerase
MEIDHDVQSLTVFQEVSIATALDQIDANSSKIVFTVDERGRLTGVMTDGDFRRWLLRQEKIDTRLPVSVVARKNVTTGRIDGTVDEWEKLFSDAVQIIPLIDSHGQLRAAVRPHKQHFRIGRHKIGNTEPVYVVGEIGNNHNGDIERARHLVDAVSAAGADCAKFQMRQMRSIYRGEYNVDTASEDLSVEYTLDLLNRFSLSNDDLFRIFDYCHARNIEPLCTPWDAESVAILESYGMNAYKVASPDLTNHDLLCRIAETQRPILLSTGMSEESEIRESADLLKRLGATFVLLHCNSTYPAPYGEINLAYMDKLREIGNCPVGYSGHERGINVAIAAVARGARVIEKHCTLDRSLEGNDHKVSLLPEELRQMVDGIRQTAAAIGSAAPRRISQGEMLNRSNLAKSLVAKRDIVAGEIIMPNMLDVRSPGQGIQPNHRNNVVGQRARRRISAGQFIFRHDFECNLTVARQYSFARPWGIPVRYHDWRTLAAMSNPDLLEFHLSYMDLKVDFRSRLDRRLDFDLIVHCPELFANDHILDLCAPSETYRLSSVANAQRVLDLTREMKSVFPAAKRPRVVINLGGFSEEKHLGEDARAQRLATLRRSLDELDTDGVELLPQTMPPFPWHFGGQRFHNVFVDPMEIAPLCRERQLRICLDISHAQLACTAMEMNLDDYIRALAPYIAHVHIADASGVSGEGQQIGEGSVDFPALLRLLEEVAPVASFIPEVWQGHVDNGQGFWTALEKLESLFPTANKSGARPTPIRRNGDAYRAIRGSLAR